MANENFLLMQKPSASAATSTATWGIYLTSMPMLNARERKEIEANDWLDEHGDDPYFGSTIYFKAFDVTLKCAAVGTMTTIQESLNNLLSYLTTGGTELTIWSEWVKRGRTKVSFVSLSEPDYGETKDENLPFVAQFDLVLHISDPYTNVTCTQSGTSYILAEAARTVASVTYSNLTAVLRTANTASASANSTVTTVLVATATRTTLYTDGSTEVENGVVVTPTSVSYSSSNTSVATVSSAGIVTFVAANSSTTTKKSVTITAAVTYNALNVTVTTTAYQAAAVVTYYVYYGSSASVPSSIDTTNAKVLTNPTTVSITTAVSDHKKCHWVAFLSSTSYHVTTVTDVDGDDITSSCTTSTVGNYTLVAMTSAAYIGNTTKFTISR